MFNLGAALSAGDRLDGSSGFDTLNLDGDGKADGMILMGGDQRDFDGFVL